MNMEKMGMGSPSVENKPAMPASMGYTQEAVRKRVNPPAEVKSYGPGMYQPAKNPDESWADISKPGVEMSDEDIEASLAALEEQPAGPEAASEAEIDAALSGLEDPTKKKKPEDTWN